MDYEKDMQIDETALDVEWLEQPSLMMRYCGIAARLRAEADTAKENLDLVKAELDCDIRANSSHYGLEKLTETLISNTILLQKRFQEAMEILGEARLEDAMGQAAVRSLELRKKALENLVILHGQQYFAGPSIPRDISKEWEKKRTDDTVHEIITTIKKERKRKV